jgi:Leucine-rich repeat (LRR) protein
MASLERLSIMGGALPAFPPRALLRVLFCAVSSLSLVSCKLDDSHLACLAELPLLTSLDVSANFLTRLPRLARPGALRALDASWNFLDHRAGALLGGGQFGGLRELDLDGNSLLDQGVMQILAGARNGALGRPLRLGIKMNLLSESGARYASLARPAGQYF